MTRTAFLFDLDGTLIDSVYQHVLAWQEALQGEGISLPTWVVHQRIGMSDGLIIDECLRTAGRAPEGELVKRLKSTHTQAYRALAKTVKPFPGAEQLLAYLDAEDIPWAIATSGDLDSATPNLAALGLDPGAIAIVTRNDAAFSKPDPDLFVKAADRLATSVERTVVVGDSQWDMLAAARCGALGIGMLCGGHGSDELQRSGAVRIYDDPAMLLQKINEIVPRTI